LAANIFDNVDLDKIVKTFDGADESIMEGLRFQLEVKSENDDTRKIEEILKMNQDR
jgi:hypothetical protein